MPRQPVASIPAQRKVAVAARPAQKQAAYQPAAAYRRQTVQYNGPEEPGTIVIDTHERFLFHVNGDGTATRYGVGVGRAGFEWSGTAQVGRKSEWPDWRPPAEMIEREKAKGRTLPDVMPGGPNNPLGARALYLYQGGNDTLYRIHGTNNPRSIGLAMSSGCIRMMNEDVTDLYSHVSIGTKVVVM
ncbi:MAG: L,D-transpeptidase [Rhodobiaceae bacterium]|nr:L,D-transpeptidase [Rhodobiaceae bacterium]